MLEENIPLIVVGVIIALLVLKSFIIVKEQSAVIVERFGKFIRIANSGIGVIIPFVDRKAATVN